MMRRLAYWSPRVLGILGILFLSSFALDVFASDTPILSIVTGLFIHLLPSFFLIGLLALAWKHELIGGIAFMLISTVPFMALSNAPLVNALLAAPFFLTGALFVLSWYVAVRDIPTSNS